MNTETNLAFSVVLSTVLATAPSLPRIRTECDELFSAQQTTSTLGGMNTSATALPAFATAEFAVHHVLSGYADRLMLQSQIMDADIAEILDRSFWDSEE